jgi:hypothetical protein
MSNARYNMDTYKDLTAEQWHNAYQDLKREHDTENTLLDSEFESIRLGAEVVKLSNQVAGDHLQQVSERLQQFSCELEANTVKETSLDFCNIGRWNEGDWDEMEASIKAVEDEDIVKLIQRLIGKLEK